MVHKGSNKCIRQSYRISIAIIFADTCILRLSNFAGCILLSAGSRGLVLSHFWGRSKPTWRRSVWSGIFYWLVRNMTGIYYIYIGENWIVIDCQFEFSARFFITSCDGVTWPRWMPSVSARNDRNLLRTLYWWWWLYSWTEVL